MSVAPLSRLLAVLVMAVGLLCGLPGQAAAGHTPGDRGPVAFQAVDDTPGCRPTPSHDTGKPSVPPRGSTSYELMPVLFETPGSGDAAALDRLLAPPAPGRAPPAAGPPTPVDLGVLLRV
ncbi:hypothetical protein [Streptomyces finlayi]|uniref:hypothetical protein n=1 Tax=Streptomyces finlayi TaxID=67296 RepID=UPI001675B907|nr:hypothetical protein [Streptomyces finlayi]